MIRSVAGVLSVLSLALLINAVAATRIPLERDLLRREEGTGLLMPSIVYRIISLEFKGLLSDAIFSRSMTYYGKKVILKEELTKEEWDWIYNSSDVATDLDPYFLDPYLFASVNLAWDANMVKEADSILEKAFRYRDWDWTIPFYLGFNHFYFLQDNEKAASYLMESAKRPGSGAIVPTLAARLTYTAKRTENAIIFLQEVLKKTEDESLRYIYEERLKALKAILFLEKAVTAYENRFNKRPEKLSDLISSGIIREIPADPYGGKFYIDKDGSIKTTSELVHKKG